MSTVDTSQWSKTLASIGSALSTQLQDKMMKKADADGSGGVDNSEFKAAMEKLSAKLGTDLSTGSDDMFAGLDSDSDGSLGASELGQLVQNLFAPAADTQSFMQSRGDVARFAEPVSGGDFRGDEVRFAELDTDGNGSLTMAELGIQPAVTTTTITTTTVVSSSDAVTDGSATALTAATGAADTAPAAVSADPLASLMKTVDIDGNGDISGSELTAFVTQLSSQMEAASRKYNETALASNDSAPLLNAAA